MQGPQAGAEETVPKPSVTESVSYSETDDMSRLRKAGPHDSRCKVRRSASSQRCRETGKKTARNDDGHRAATAASLILGRGDYPLVPRRITLRSRSYPAWDPGEGDCSPFKKPVRQRMCHANSQALI